MHKQLLDSRPESRLDLVRLLIQKTRRQPPAERSWTPVEQKLEETAQAVPGSARELTLLRADLLAAEGWLSEAREFLREAIGREPRELSYRLALARLLLYADQSGEPPVSEAIKTLDQAERELGRSTTLTSVRVQALSRLGTDEARRAIHKIADELSSLSSADQPPLVEALARASLALGEPERSVQLLGQLAESQPEDRRIQLEMLDLVTAVGDLAEVPRIVNRLRAIEGEKGATWRYAEAIHHLAGPGRRPDGDRPGPVAHTIEVEILQGDWWGASLLRGDLAELENKPEKAVDHYTRAIELGNDSPFLARRLAGLLLRWGSTTGWAGWCR